MGPCTGVAERQACNLSCAVGLEAFQKDLNTELRVTSPVCHMDVIIQSFSLYTGDIIEENVFMTEMLFSPLGKCKRSKLSVPLTAKRLTACSSRQILWCWWWAWHLSHTSWSGKESWSWWNPQLPSLTSAEVPSRSTGWPRSVAQLLLLHPAQRGHMPTVIRHGRNSSLSPSFLLALCSLPARCTQKRSPSTPGAVVDQEALVAALQTGVIQAAALDVTSPEPLPRLPSLLISREGWVSPAEPEAIPAAGRKLPPLPWHVLG